MSARAALRVGLLLLVVLQSAAGIWGLLTPRSFYENAWWVALLPPYNEHLVSDVGAFNLAMAVLIGAAAVVLERRMVVVAMATYLTSTVPHLVFHSTHLEGFPATAAVAQTATLAVTVVLPLVLALLALRTGAPARPGPALPRVALGRDRDGGPRP